MRLVQAALPLSRGGRFSLTSCCSSLSEAESGIKTGPVFTDFSFGSGACLSGSLEIIVVQKSIRVRKRREGWCRKQHEDCHSRLL